MIDAEAAKNLALDHLQLRAGFVENPSTSLTYQTTQEGIIRLAWMFELNPTDHSDHWIIRVDAMDGSILGKNNYTVYCNFDHRQSAVGSRQSAAHCQLHYCNFHRSHRWRYLQCIPFPNRKSESRLSYVV